MEVQLHPPVWLASSPGHSQILSRSRGEKLEDGLQGVYFFFGRTFVSG